MLKLMTSALAVALLTLPCQAGAQTLGPAGIGSLEAGYGNGRAMETERFNPSTRDSQGNRIIKDGVIQYGEAGGRLSTDANTAVYGAGFLEAGTSNSATAAGNIISIMVEGSNNTVVLNADQTNTGAISATSVLNGSAVSSTGSGN